MKKEYLFLLFLFLMGCNQKSSSYPIQKTIPIAYNISGTWIRKDPYSGTMLDLRQHNNKIYGEGYFWGCLGQCYFDFEGRIEKDKVTSADDIFIIENNGEALKQIKMGEFENLEDHYFYRQTKIENYSRPTSKTISILIQELSDPEKSVRKTAVWLLGELGIEAKECVDKMIPLLKDQDEEVRIEVSLALKNFGVGSTKALESLMEVLKNENEQELVRRNALNSAIEIYPKSFQFGHNSWRIPPFLLETLEDKNKMIRFYALKALERYANREIKDRLEKLLQSEKEELVRKEAEELLTKINEH